MLPAITAFYAGLLGLIFLALTALVSYGRHTYKITDGDGANPRMRQMIRAHANFAEYVPLTLILIALLESTGTAPAIIRTLLIILVVARALHPFGMLAPDKTLQQTLCRGFGALATWLTLLTAAALLLTR